jgi:transcription elongation factor Elf1
MYTATLPSSGQEVKFRPFLVKEQKSLLAAVDSSFEQQSTLIQNIVTTCTNGAVNGAVAPVCDVEYMFVQIRSKSVGENIDMLLTCGECGEKQETKLDLTQVKVDVPSNHDININLGNGLLMELQDPTLENNLRLNEDATIDDILLLITKCIRNIWRGEEVFNAKDYTSEELLEFVENLSPKNLESIEQFFRTIPTLRHPVPFKCEKCGADNVAVLEGLQSFFV